MKACLENDSRHRAPVWLVGPLLLLVFAGLWSCYAGEQPAPVNATIRATIPLDGSLYASAFTADVRALASVSWPPASKRPGEVKLWDGTTGRERAALPDTEGKVHTLAFAPDGKTLATGGAASADPSAKGRWEGVVKLWDGASGKERAVLRGHTSFVVSLRFSPDGLALASATQGVKGENELKLWDVASGRELATIPGRGYQASQLEFTPDGKILAWGTKGLFSREKLKWEPEIKLIDVPSGKELASLKAHTHDLTCLAFSPDGKTLASGGGLRPTQPPGDGKTQVLGRKALPEEPGQLKLWEVATGRERADLRGHSGCVLAMAFSPDGKALAAAGAGPPTPDGRLWYWTGEVKLWDVATGQERATIEGHPVPRGTVHAVAFSADGKTLASAGGNEVKLWDLASGKARAGIKGDQFDNWFWVGYAGDRLVLLSRHREVQKLAGMRPEELKVGDVPVVK
jgi:WD40 repeat protein